MMSFHKALILIAVSAFPALPQAQLQFGTVPSQKAAIVVALPSGSTLFVGTDANTGGIAAWATAPSSFAGSIRIGSGKNLPVAATVDANGNIWIAGNTDSDDFPLVNPIVSKKAPYRTAGFVMELNSNATTVLFATYLGGQGECLSACASYASAITVDAFGNAYVGGSTDESDFPSTRPGSLNGRPFVDSFGDQFFYSYIVKVTPQGKLGYSILLDTGAASCVGGSSCIGHSGTAANINSLAVDSTGLLTIAESMAIGPGRILRLAADGSKLLASTSLGDTAGGTRNLSIAEDSQGSVFVFGVVAPLSQSGLPQFGTGIPGLFTAKLNSSNTLIYRTELGQSPDARPDGILLDSSGSAWITGTSSSTSGALAGGLGIGSDFLLQLDPTSATARTLIRFPRGVISSAPVFDTQHRLLIPGENGAFLTLPAGYTGNTPAVVGFTNSASFAMNTGIYPGALVTIFGLGMPDKPGPITIGGVPAVVLYASANQINLQIPFEVAAGAGVTPVQVPLSTGSVTLQLPVTRSLGIFTADGTHAAAVNADGTVNSATNPASAGSIVTLYGTGAIWPDGLTDGGIPTAAAPLDQGKNGLQMVDSAGVPGSILYAGAAPQIINGVFQLNVLIPVGAKPPFTLQSIPGVTGLLASNPITIYSK